MNYNNSSIKINSDRVEMSIKEYVDIMTDLYHLQEQVKSLQYQNDKLAAIRDNKCTCKCRRKHR